jgi:hypothetical protein
MNKDNMNISKVETYLNEIFDNVISKNTFFSSMPEKETIDASWTDMVHVEIPNGIEDREAYGQGTILVWLYARPLSSGRKNVKKMSELETKLNEVIKNASHPIYSISRRLTFTDYNTSINWHCNAVEVILKVF